MCPVFNKMDSLFLCVILQKYSIIFYIRTSESETYCSRLFYMAHVQNNKTNNKTRHV